MITAYHQWSVPESQRLRLALEELDFFSHEVKILGVYHGHPFRFREQAGE